MSAFTTNRDLLNVRFEGYKLSSKALTQIRDKIEPVRVNKLKDDEYSYQCIKAYTLHNHLHHDPTGPTSVYWCNDKESIIKASLEGEFISTECVFSFPKSVDTPSANFSMLFVSSELGIACAGDDKLILFKRVLFPCATKGTVSGNSEKWITRAPITIGNAGHPVVIVTARQGEKCEHVDVLCAVLPLNAEANARNDKVENSLISYEWVRIKLGESSSEKNGEMLQMKTVCELQSKSLVMYASFQVEATSKSIQLLIISETEPQAIMMQPEANSSSTEAAPAQSDRKNGKKVDWHDGEEEEEPDRHYGLGYKEDENEGKVYTWDQSEEDVIITFRLTEGVTKKDVFVTIEPPEVVVSMSDGSNLLRGELTHDVDMDGTTWTMDKNILEVTLGKKVEGMNWKYLLKEKNSGKTASHPLGEFVDELTEQEKQKAKEVLKRLHEEESMPSVKKACAVQPNVVQDMLEECDRSEEDPLLFVVTEEGKFVAKVDIQGHQVLFVSPGPGGPGHPNMFSLRHDVDATIWLPHSCAPSSKDRWTHLSTFNALGYVQASKRERKFTTCSPDLSCAVICDGTRHVFMYSQPDKSSKTAVEYVHTFLETGIILGVVASSNGTVFVLTDKELCILKIADH